MAKILTGKQKRFVLEYLIDFNASRAAAAAGYSKKTAYSIGFTLLKKVEIQDAIHKEQQKHAHKLEITVEKILQEYARIGFADMQRYFTWGKVGVTLQESTGLSSNDTAAIAEISQTVTENGGTIRLKLHDKKGALDSLAKHLGMFDGRGSVEDGVFGIVRLPVSKTEAEWPVQEDAASDGERDLGTE